MRRSGRTEDLVRMTAETLNAEPTARVLLAVVNRQRGDYVFSRVARLLEGNFLRRSNEIVTEAGGWVRYATERSTRGTTVDHIYAEWGVSDNLMHAVLPCLVAR